MNHLDPAAILPKLQALHLAMRRHLHAQVVAASRPSPPPPATPLPISGEGETLSAKVGEGDAHSLTAEVAIRGGDTIYALDTRGEEILLPFCHQWGRAVPFLLVAEGLPSGEQLFGCDRRADAAFILICDPIDGTRPLMYDKRSAWMLTGVAPNIEGATLADIEIAMQGELPTSRALYADVLWAVRGQGAAATTSNMVTDETRQWQPRPSGAQSVAGGYAMFSKFFIGSKGWLANLEEELIEQVLGNPPDGQPHTFDDQYISSGGQLYELMTGRDRFNADLRPLAHARLHGGASSRLCAHPYDLCTELIARECGVVVTDEHGQAMTAPLDVHSPVSWIGYANAAIRAEIEPVLMGLLDG